MTILQSTIDSQQATLHFHRRKVQQYFGLLCALVLLAFCSVIALKLISTSAETALASEIAKAANARIPIKDKRNPDNALEITMPDMDSLDYKSDRAYRSEYLYGGSIVLLVMAILGLIRHHLRRIAITEDRLFHIEKAHAILNAGEEYDPILVSSILGSGNHEGERNVDEPPLYPSQEILERSITALLDISKLVGKHIKK